MFTSIRPSCGFLSYPEYKKIYKLKLGPNLYVNCTYCHRNVRPGFLKVLVKYKYSRNILNSDCACLSSGVWKQCKSMGGGGVGRL
jgi:hypothetical protein